MVRARAGLCDHQCRAGVSHAALPKAHLAHDRRGALFTSTSRPIRLLNGQRSKCSEAFAFDTAPKYLLRDRDGFTDLISENKSTRWAIAEVLSAPRSPRAYVERVIGSILRECRDRVIVFDEDSCVERYGPISLLP
jgi:putative transposase